MNFFFINALLLHDCLFFQLRRELSNSKLEQFDLDDAFSSERAYLAQITNKCTDEDLEYFVNEDADTLGRAFLKCQHSVLVSQRRMTPEKADSRLRKLTYLDQLLYIKFLR